MNDASHPIHLIVQYYRCADAARQAEIDTCLRNNLENLYISVVHLLTEEQFDLSDFPSNDKVVQTVIGERLTFERAFRYANESDPDGQRVWVLSNADIYFDETLQFVEWQNFDGVVYALTRHDVQPDGLTKLVDPVFAHGSQDSWFFRSLRQITTMFASFRLGIPGCDNRIAYELLRCGYRVVNPAKKLRCNHLDLTKVVNVAERTAMYMKLNTSDNIAAGDVAPPPYQFYIYPTEEMTIGGIDVFRDMQQSLLALTEANDQLMKCAKHIEELNMLVAGRDQQIAERDQQITEITNSFNGLLDSVSWKITTPVRRLLDAIAHKKSTAPPVPPELNLMVKEKLWPKVSIIIPVYNGSNYLRTAIESALTQTYRNIEVLVINDGSNDDSKTESIAKSYGDRIRYIHKINGGVASALNLGLQAMTGEYFSWLSHDDIYFPNKIETQINYIEMTGKRDSVLFSNWEHIDSYGNSLGSRIIHPGEAEKSIYAVMNCVINGCTLLVPKKCFEDVGNFDEKLPTTQDYDLWFRIARQYEFIHIPKILVRYRIHPAQDSHRHPHHLKEQNDLHVKFNMILTEPEILNIEKSVSIFHIKRAIFYKNKFADAEKYAYEQFKNNITRQNITLLPECLYLLAKYKIMH